MAGIVESIDAVWTDIKNAAGSVTGSSGQKGVDAQALAAATSITPPAPAGGAPPPATTTSQQPSEKQGWWEATKGWIHDKMPFLDPLVGNKGAIGADGKPEKSWLSIFGLGGDGEESGWGAKLGFGAVGAALAGGLGGMGLIGTLLIGLLFAFAGPSITRKIGSMLGIGGDSASHDGTGASPEVSGTAPGQGKGASAPAQEHKGESFVDSAVAFMKHPTNSIKGMINHVPAEYYNAMDFFESKKGGSYTQAQAAGIVASLHLESGMNPYIPGDGGKAKGIGQWHADRQAEFKKLFGHAIDDTSIGKHKMIEEQLAFVTYEMNQGKERVAGDALRRTTTAEEAGAVFRTYYERPGTTAEDKQREANNGAMMAQQLSNAKLNRDSIVPDTAGPQNPGDAKAVGDAIRKANGGGALLASAANDPEFQPLPGTGTGQGRGKTAGPTA